MKAIVSSCAANFLLDKCCATNIEIDTPLALDKRGCKSATKPRKSPIRVRWFSLSIGARQALTNASRISMIKAIGR